MSTAGSKLSLSIFFVVFFLFFCLQNPILKIRDFAKDMLDFLSVSHELEVRSPKLDAEEVKIWHKKRSNARAVVELSLSDVHIKYVRRANMTLKMWWSIQYVFRSSPLLNYLNSYRHFCTMISM